MRGPAVLQQQPRGLALQLRIVPPLPLLELLLVSDSRKFEGRDLETTKDSLTSRSRDQACSRRDSNMSSLGSLQRTDESGRLSLTEVSSWALSFTALMESPAGRRIFMEFLCSEHSDENMLFWQACESLKTETRRTAIGERAKQIYLDYISILSPKEVSIDATVRETINGNMAAPTVHIFDDAQAQIYALMHRDSYPRFLNSLLYQSLLQSLGPISPTSNT